MSREDVVCGQASNSHGHVTLLSSGTGSSGCLVAMILQRIRPRNWISSGGAASLGHRGGGRSPTVVEVRACEPRNHLPAWLGHRGGGRSPTVVEVRACEPRNHLPGSLGHRGGESSPGQEGGFEARRWRSSHLNHRRWAGGYRAVVEEEGPRPGEWFRGSSLALLALNHRRQADLRSRRVARIRAALPSSAGHDERGGSTVPRRVRPLRGHSTYAATSERSDASSHASPTPGRARR
jgi:hypothetical protein